MIIFEILIWHHEFREKIFEPRGLILRKWDKTILYKKISPIIFLIFFIINPRIVKAQPLFEVERESFCREVRDHEPLNVFSGVAEIRKGDGIFFWIEIKAGPRALSMLETRGELPIFHAWASRIGVTDLINVGIRDDVWIKNREVIRNEVKMRGFFTWRTQSFKRNFREGIYYVSILDANKRPVRKTGASNEAFRPEIIIRIIQ